MSTLRNAVFGAVTALAAAAMPATAQVQCGRISPGDPTLEQFIVFFGVGASALDQAAQQVVQRAASRATATFKTEICLIGRTSPTGSPQANQRLAQQRIQSVQNALVQRGVQRNTLGSFVPAAAFGAQRDRAENRADRSVTIILVR
jgi:outer membrane protein OmpA-like peptidoglycan-associated protein